MFSCFLYEQTEEGFCVHIDTIDKGKAFDFGNTAEEYGKYRDIYPQSMYDKLCTFGIGRPGQKILDLGSGTAVLPRNMYGTGASFTATDPSQKQLKEGKRLAEKAGMDAIAFKVCSAEDTGVADNRFDAVTAVQCFWYFDVKRAVPEIARVLRPDGAFCKISMEWLPFEDTMIQEMEALVLRYNPDWTGEGFRPVAYSFPDWARPYFALETVHTYKEKIVFDKDAWRGRIRTCRGIGASLPEERVRQFDREYGALLLKYPGNTVAIRHQIQIEVYRLETKPSNRNMPL